VTRVSLDACITAFLDARVEDEPASETWSRQFDAGLAWVHFPIGAGGLGLGRDQHDQVRDRLRAAGVPDPFVGNPIGHGMAAPTVLAHARPELRDRLLRPLFTNEEVWCQLFSEPGAGSDLAGLATSAVRDGDGWRVTGQKVWTSLAHLASWGLLLARTDPDAPKHRGITFLLVPMEQPGVEVRPIEMINGDSEFNEVFFSGARCPKENVIGGVNNGWAVAMTLLGYERGDAAATFPVSFRIELDRLTALARERGLDAHPVIRQRLAAAHTTVEIMKWSGWRTLTAYLAGGHPGPEAGLFKLQWSEHHRRLTELAVDILGAAALAPTGREPASSFQTDDPGAPNDSASWVGTFLTARAGTIYAGSSEIQRNIIGEMVLGLPKEPRPEGAGASWKAEQQRA